MDIKWTPNWLVYMRAKLVICFSFLLEIPLIEILLIGTFGQASLWDIGSSSTYEYPMMPKDVVFEPLTDDDVGSRDPDAEMFDRVAETKSEESSEERDGDEEETNLEFDLEIDDVFARENVLFLF